MRVTAVPAFAITACAARARRVRSEGSEIQVKLSAAIALSTGRRGFVLGIRVSFNPAPNLVARKLAMNRSVLCASPAYLKQHGTPRRIEDLRQHECVLFPPLAPKGVWTLRRDRRKYSVQVTGVLETDEMDVVRAAVTAGLGIGILPAYMVGDALQHGQLVPLLRQFQVVPESAIYLVYLPNRTLSSRVRALIDFLAGRFGPVPSWEVGW